MPYSWKTWLAVFTLSLGMIAAACAATEKVTVFAAASLTNALQEIAERYQQEKPVSIVASYASSSTLARQIEQGAPADIFISADQQWMDYAQNKQLIEKGSRYTLLGNALVVIAPKSADVKTIDINAATDWKSLLKGGRLAVGDPDHVPAGIYAKEALQNLKAWDTVSPLMARASDVRGALALVEREEAPLGIVYGSDAVASAKVKVVGTFPAGSHKPVEYPVAIVKSHDTAAAKAFSDYLKTSQAADVFKRHGFTPR
ncbi:molybdate ABC transporter substrate-binding protein [Lonsdalea populi]|uniref:Molybdate ABC transporter substrate-binding protein n=1 Tax=Lonsdalea populi TaxID=1172565 RepID=A0A3N0UL60_9GAMM|nr:MULTISPECIES: molybdate ABC transporter substrate-binding protein [Lonsdalea]RAT17311.1 molybdate ABC transporter substrate-binding protein [Lonsdalea quercina]RAT30177.1 molybdate ABC transporter substrate-binding protein [Lonsdalea populi]RAT37645.1 molybdate ABC transporter substrate-binding protein [Lonsdalea populi]RAT48374.1 molybdate ABC transporter substrate-binding protein [Lonsdalea populi]RAT50043.1 molybdate ABC transporter substrate-binding protein [Lonsdalea populi]